MTPNRPPTDAGPNDGDATRDLGRRRFLAAGAGLGAAAIAGCSTETGPGGADYGGTSGDDDGSSGDDDGSTSGDDGASAAGTFRLLISDQPVAIDEFDELDVSFDRARIFRAGGDGGEDAEPTEAPTGSGGEGDEEAEDDQSTESATDAGTEAETADGTSAATPTGTDKEPEEEGADDDGQRGFFVIDLGGATVDLTQVVGEKAMGVFEGELSEGRYAKIELYAEDVEGTVDGEAVDVKIPSGKLQIVKPFEVVAGETLSFVFDINVVKKGGSGGYNLLPVISESGVAGRDVEVTEVGDGGDDAEGSDGAGTEEDDTGEAETTDGPGDGGDGGPPDDPGGDE